jgi:SAM-dependent methyltransferase
MPWNQTAGTSTPIITFADEIGARSVLDIGCGTGTFACMLARAGKVVVGLDPAAASIAVARRKVGAEAVRWIEGDVTALPHLQVDLVTMTGNVAQVFLNDDEWAAVLQAGRAALAPGGHLVFETRDPARQAWRAWNREETFWRVELANTEVVETWTELTKVQPPFVSFRQTFSFAADRVMLASESSLRFRDRGEIERSLQTAGFEAVEGRDAPDRPGLEMVFVCRRPDGHDPSLERVRLTSSRTELHRVGGVVVRAAGPWSASVHALLRYLQTAGFPGAPRSSATGSTPPGTRSFPTSRATSSIRTPGATRASPR